MLTNQKIKKKRPQSIAIQKTPLKRNERMNNRQTQTIKQTIQQMKERTKIQTNEQQRNN